MDPVSSACGEGGACPGRQPARSARKGIAWKLSAQTNLDPAASEVLLIAIARARSWMNDLAEGRVNSFEVTHLHIDDVA
jgi:hypothetical protein